MEKITNKKLSPWKKGDWIGNIFVYLLNICFVFALLIGASYLRSQSSGEELKYFLMGISRRINFLVLEGFIFFAMFIFFYFENRDFLKKLSNSQMVFLIIEIALICSFLCGYYLNIYIRPLAFVAIMVLFLTDSKTAVFINIVFSVLAFLFDVFVESVYIEEINHYVSYELIYFIVMGIISGTLAVYVMRNEYSRGKLLLLSLIISLPAMVCVALPRIEYGNQENLFLSMASGIVSGPLSVSLFILILPIFEGIFKKVTAFKLAELTNHKSKIISTMIKNAPGTFNHSIVVSNIAEACATAIGEDALLTRTCAYYHDIGKLRRPEYFKENQVDVTNPHDDLTPELSANIIKSHADDGYKLARKNRIPLEIANVAREHHGTMPIWYFYDKAKKFTDGEVNINQYCYPGPKPQSKISAIIMIADGCEAVSRTLPDRSREKVTEAVKEIVNSRMELGQFDDCEITLKELRIIINAIVNSLTGVYHNRIEYPKISLSGIKLETEKAEKTSKGEKTEEKESNAKE